MILIFTLLYIMFPKYECKIIRSDDGRFIARFTIVDSDFRIKANCIRNITRFTEPQECSAACIREKKCISINRHRVKGFCEMLAISKFNHTGALKRDFDWVHYETDDDEQNIGAVCTQLSPCNSYQVCEDTLKSNPAYICRCKDGFIGENCETYNGPGSSQSNPAASCYLLLLKFKNISDGDYWFQGKDKPIKCERRVDGGYTLWSSFDTCSDVICGTQQRNRSCTSPRPKGGGRSCAHLGPKKEMKRCYPKEICADCSFKLFIDTPYELRDKNLFATFGTMLKEFKIQFDFKLDWNKMFKNRYYNLFHFTHGKTESLHTEFGERMPAIFLIYETHSPTKITISLFSGLNNEARLIHSSRDDLSVFHNWIHVEIKQQQISDEYILLYEFNGKILSRDVNPKPRGFQDMKLYLNSQGSGVLQIQNMFVQGYCNMTKEKGYLDYLAGSQ